LVGGGKGARMMSDTVVLSNSAMRMRVLTHPAYTHRLIVACSLHVHKS
jgi:hypothetical protein